MKLAVKNLRVLLYSALGFFYLLPYFVYAEEKSSSWTLLSLFGIKSWEELLANIGNAVISIFGLVLWVAGVLLNEVVEITIVGMGRMVNNIGAIDTAWALVRDVGNIAIIFGLLAIGIATILRVSGYGVKDLLVKLIIVALLINFSLFFTKVIVDVSNYLSIIFYSQIVEQDGEEIGISDQLVNALKLQTIYSNSSAVGTSGVPDSDTAALGNPIPAQPGQSAVAALSPWQIFLSAMLGSIFILISAFVFFAFSVLLSIRFAVLVILMILSPLAFVLMAIPKAKGLAQQWWESLFKYTIFAPAFMLLLYITLSIVQDPSFFTSQASNDLNFSAALTGIEGSATIFINYLIVTIFMVASLIIASRLGTVGSSTMMKWGGQLRNYGLRQTGKGAATLPARFLRTTVGRGASALSQSEGLRERGAKKGVMGTLARGTLRASDRTARSSFDARTVKGLGKGLGIGEGLKGGYNQKLAEQAQRRKKTSESLERFTKTKDDRVKEEALQDEYTEALRIFEAAETVEDRQAAKELVTQSRKNIGEHFDSMEARGDIRRQEYGKTLVTEKMFFGFGPKVARKNKEGGDLVRKKQSDRQKLGKRIGEAIKTNP